MLTPKRSGRWSKHHAAANVKVVITFSVAFIATTNIAAVRVVTSIVIYAPAAVERRASKCSLKVDLQRSRSFLGCLASWIHELFVGNVIALVVEVQVDASGRFFVTAAQVIVQIGGRAQHKETPLPSGHSNSQLVEVPADFADRGELRSSR